MDEYEEVRWPTCRYGGICKGRYRARQIAGYEKGWFVGRCQRLSTRARQIAGYEK